MNKSSEILNEHEKIRLLLKDINFFITNERIDFLKLTSTLRNLLSIWDVHEKKEETLMKSLASQENLPTQTMIIEQHRELKGHWKVIQKAVDSGDEQEIIIALDTDGKMLTEKLLNHMNMEEEFFSQIPKIILSK